ncbi:MAG TPA: kelch repeat-containing protein [Bacteroidia bacterium]
MKRTLLLLPFIFTQALALGPWTQKCSMPGLGRHLACSMVIGGRAYIGGGWDGVNTYNDFWEYDPGTNSWTQKANTPALMWNVPCFGIDTAGYFCYPGNTWMFCPNGNTWTNVNPAAPPSTYLEECKWVINGKGYVRNQTNIFEFNPQNFQWTNVYTLPSSNFAPDIGFAIGNKAYMMDNSYQKFWEYDPTAVTLTQKAVCPLNNTMGIGFGLNGKGYCGLGFTITQVGSIKDMAEYDPATDSWRRIDDLEGQDRRKATSFVIGNRGYITCGSCGINLNDLWEFDNSKVTDVNEQEKNTEVNVFPNPSVDGKFYFSTNTNNISSIVLFDAQGKKVLAQKFGSNCSIDLSDAGDGIYFAELLDRSGEIKGRKKLILSK